jgi:glucose/arabinose dehydrogenase
MTIRRTTSLVAVLLCGALAACTGGSPGSTVGEAVPAGTATTTGGGSATSSSADQPSRSVPTPVPIRSTVAPKLAVETVTGGLRHGWDLGFLPDGKVLITQRPGVLTLLSGSRPGARATTVRADFSDLLVAGEGGLMGLVVHPDFATSREFTTCQTHTEGGRAVDIRLVTWRLDPDGASADRVQNLVTGLPVAAGGRHSGCRPTLAPDGTLLVGTGDTANASVSQDRTSLGGKVLRVDLKTGQAPPGNPFRDATGPRERLVYTYGHRNVQGVAVRPGTGQVYTAEHGPSYNDEVNVLRPGANYGWDPSRGGTVGGYDESVPMTDRDRFPDAVEAVWQSGSTTQAVCAAAFLSGKQWGSLDGTLVITALKGAKLLLLSLDAAGAVTAVAVPPEFDNAFGRLRAARLGPDGALYVTTTNGDDDKLLRVTPA